MAQPGGRPSSKSEQITGREQDRIAAGLRERYVAWATIRDLVIALTETRRLMQNSETSSAITSLTCEDAKS